MNIIEKLPVRFTVDDLERMVAAGVFVNHPERIELIEGEFLMMSPASDEHDTVIRYLTEWSVINAQGQFQVAVQQGLRLLKSESMPEPDLYWLATSHGRKRATPPSVPLVIEVSASSLEYDSSTKRRLYAMEGIPEFWIADLAAESMIVHREPVDERYTIIETFKTGQSVSSLIRPDKSLDLNWLFRG